VEFVLSQTNCRLFMCIVHGSLVVASSPHQLLHNAAAISSSSSAVNGGSSSHSAQQQTAAAGSGAAATSAAAAIASLGPIAYFVRPDNVLNTQLTASIMKVSACNVSYHAYYCTSVSRARASCVLLRIYTFCALIAHAFAVFGFRYWFVVCCIYAIVQLCTLH
jgi:hypothetical protein